jgi:PAS domain S-box-containing protein
MAQSGRAKPRAPLPGGELRASPDRPAASLARRGGFERFFEFAPAAMTISRLSDGLILDANEEAERLLGYSRDEMVGRTALDLGFWEVDDREALRKPLTAKGVVRDLHVRLRAGDGAIRAVRIGAEVVDLGGEPLLLASLIDDSEHEQRLSESDARFRAAFVTGADAYVIVERDDGRILEVNDRFLELYGYNRKECVGRTSLDLGLWANPEQRVSMLAELQRRGRVDNLEVLGARKGGETFPVLYSASLLQIAGQPPLVFGAIRDITALNSAKEALRQSEARFRTLIDDAPVAIGVSRDGKMVSVNGTYLRLLGFETEEELRGHNFTEHISPKDHVAEIERELRRTHGGAFETDFEAHCVRRDGSTFPCHFLVSKVELPDGPATLAFLADLTRLKHAEADLALEARVRDSLMDALHRLPAGASGEQAAEAVCEALGELPGVAIVALLGFSFSDHLTALAWRGPERLSPSAQVSVTSRALSIRDRAGGGPWAEPWTPREDDGPWARALTAGGIKAMAYAPVAHSDHVDGVLIVGTSDLAFAETIVERIAIVNISETASALLAERLHAWRDGVETRAALEQTIAQRAFSTVFQPIVDLDDGEVVGFEALSRFDSGQQPEACFSDAWAVGIGVDLEIATLESAVAVSHGLPPGSWLNLNVSPQLLNDVERMRALISEAARPVVLEVTEHEPIKDYAAIRRSVSLLGREVRLAVDDAGSGVANFGHIIELSPDFVKLDVSLVHGVNANLGRQALVVAMQHFARTSGCHIIAEGIETPEEAATLQGFHVEFGQGFLLGRPSPVEELAVPEPALADGGAIRTPRVASTRHPEVVRSASPKPLESRPVRVAIVDGQPLVAQAVAALLEPDPRLKIAGVAKDTADAVALIEETQPDVVVCDLQLGDESGLDLLRRYPGGWPAFVMYSSYDHPIYHRAAFQSGAAGFVLKTAEPEELIAAIVSSAEGRSSFSTSTMQAVRHDSGLPTPRELDVLNCLANGQSTSEIAAALGIGRRTVDGHLGHLFDRTGVLSRTELVLHAMREGWIRPSSAESEGSRHGAAQADTWVVDGAMQNAGRRKGRARRTADRAPDR